MAMRKRKVVDDGRQVAEQEFVDGARADQAEKAKKPPRPKAEKRVGFNLQIPEGLHRELTEYSRQRGRRDESMTAIILRGTQRYLHELERCNVEGCEPPGLALGYREDQLVYCVRCGREMFGRTWEDLKPDPDGRVEFWREEDCDGR